MGKAEKARLKALAKQSDNAQMIGHALLECDPNDRNMASKIILGGLDRHINGLTASGKDAEVKQQTLYDMMRAVYRQGIEVPADWKERVASLVNADKALASKQAESAKKGRDELQSEREFRKAWEANQAMRARSGNASDAAGAVATTLSGSSRED